MSLRVLSPGFQSLVVDFGRPATRSLGVPVGGAADRAALALGNALVGNPPGAAALEIAMCGRPRRGETERAGVVFGAPFDLEAAGQSLAGGKTFTLQPNDVIHIRAVGRGVGAHLCVPGGLHVPEILTR